LENLLKIMLDQNNKAQTITFSQNPNVLKYYSYKNQFSNVYDHTIENNLMKNNMNCSDWKYRYGRNGHIRSAVITEDEELFKEHVDLINKKKSLGRETDVNSQEFGIYYQGKQITEKPKKEYFKEYELDKILLENLEKMKFDKMTQIQKLVIEYLINGNDVMGCAQTGSGKTIAFLLPIVNKMIKKGPPEVSSYKKGVSAPVTLILVPTRELAEQIFKEARKLISLSGINVVKVYGGVPQDSQIRELKFGCDILVATPGRLLDFMDRGLVTLSAVENFIIDEADRLLDMGFEPQLKRIACQSDILTREKRQNLMFSATFTNEIKEIAKGFMNEYYFISTYRESNANENIKHILVYSNEDQKCYKLHMILQSIQGSVIIFMDTKRGVDNLTNFLNNANYNTIAIHGDKSQIKRLEAIDKFSNGSVPILIATDVASRGLDFPTVSYVFNYEMPTNIEDYVHRIGRTGRCGTSGVAISLINESNKPIIPDLFRLMKQLKQEIPPWFENLYTTFRPNTSNYYVNKGNYNNNNFSYSKDKYLSKRERSPDKDDYKDKNYSHKNYEDKRHSSRYEKKSHF